MEFFFARARIHLAEVRAPDSKLPNVHYFARYAMTDGGWERDVAIEIDAGGAVAALVPRSSPAPGATMLETIVPAMPNVHSHAFQRAIAAETQQASRGDNDFWSWRAAMYARANSIDPDEYEREATGVFGDMLAAGYGSVAEFHYLHATPGGEAYASPSEMAQRLVVAAQRSGIALLLLPALYLHGDFGGAPLAGEQARFSLGLDGFLDVWRDLFERTRNLPRVRLGVAFHSLRAVRIEEMNYALEAVRSMDRSACVHIHVAEQRREVERCLAVHGARPIDYLYDSIDVDERWTLVHATHATPGELQRIADSKACAGLTPSTEADLGDGIFPLARYLQLGGRFGIGSDSNVRIDAAEELRWLEYVQRLASRSRNVIARAALERAQGDRASSGETAYRLAFEGGRSALGGLPASVREGAAWLDVLELPGAGVEALDRFVFASGARPRHITTAGAGPPSPSRP